MLLLVSSTLSHAVLPFNLTTDGSSVFTNGGWSGDGAVQTNISPGTYTGTIIEGMLVQNFSSGALTINNFGGDPVLPNNRLKDLNQGVVHTITLIGGTADLRLANSNAFDGGASLWNSTGLTDFQGVTSIVFTSIFETPLAGRTELIGDLANGGMGAGLSLINIGAGQALSSFTVGLSYGGVFSSAAGNASGPYDPSLPGFTSGVPSNAIPQKSAGFNTPAPGSTVFTSDAFTGTNQFLLVKGYDYDGSGDGYTAADSDNVYITSMTWTIRKDDNSVFSPDTLFVVSMDGQQHGTSFVPEPSSVILGLSGVALFAFRRRRA